MDVLVPDSDGSEEEDASFGGQPTSVRDTNPGSFVGSRAASGSGSIDTEELSDAEGAAAAAAAPAAGGPETAKRPAGASDNDAAAKRRRARVEIAHDDENRDPQAAAAPKPEPAAQPRFTERSIGGVGIAFPAGLKPHAPQMAVMAKVVMSLRLQKHALLESPTGTGKSLALLSAALAWQAAEARKLQAAAAGVAGGDGAPPPRPPRIFVCSRTHSQLSQLLSELKRTPYDPPMTVLGSRARWCCNADVQSNSSGVDIACVQAVKSRSCSHHGQADALAHQLAKMRVWDMGDMEELRANDTKVKGGGCPFFATRQLAEEAQLIFAPYNYIFDAGVRAALDIDVKGAAIIIDEGHNLEDVCRESASFEVTVSALSNCAREIEAMSKQFRETFASLSRRSVLCSLV